MTMTILKAPVFLKLCCSFSRYDGWPSLLASKKYSEIIRYPSNFKHVHVKNKAACSLSSVVVYLIYSCALYLYVRFGWPPTGSL